MSDASVGSLVRVTKNIDNTKVRVQTRPPVTDLNLSWQDIKLESGFGDFNYYDTTPTYIKCIGDCRTIDHDNKEIVSFVHRIVNKRKNSINILFKFLDIQHGYEKIHIENRSRPAEGIWLYKDQISDASHSLS